MWRPTLIGCLLLATLAAGSRPLGAQTMTPFDQKSICVDDKVDTRKLFAVAVKSVKDMSKVFSSDGSLNRSALYEQAGDHFDTFKTELDKQSYYKITKGRAEVRTGKDLVDRAGAYEIACLPPPATVRGQIDDFTKKATANLLLGKDLDSLSKPLGSRNPAKFSVINDRMSNNSAFQTELALAQNFDGRFTIKDPVLSPEYPQVVFWMFQPFVTSQTTSNSSVKLRDIDKTTLGLMFNIDSLPFFGWGTNHFSFRGGYQVDSTKSYEATVGEFVWYPYIGPLGALKLGENVSLSGGPDGIWVRPDLSARVRAGDIVENKGIPTLPADGDYLRVGAKSELTVGVQGYDILSNFTATVSYLYLENVRGGKGIDHFDKLAVDLNYKLTENYGFGLTYTRGRDEDLLIEVNQIIFAMTVKFGNPVK